MEADMEALLPQSGGICPALSASQGEVDITAHQLVAAEDPEILAKLNPSKNEVIRVSDAERPFRQSLAVSVLDKHRKELDLKLSAYMGA
jgi:hypothetical protein